MMRVGRGFTLLELLLALAVLMILGALALAPFGTFRDKELLDTTAVQILSMLSEARSATLSSRGDQPWGVHFEETRAVLFAGENFVEPDADNEEFVLDSRVELSGISISGGGDDVVFERLSGKTDNDGEITVSLRSDVNKKRVIEIFETGLFEIKKDE